jgi:hypothetical protein
MERRCPWPARVALAVCRQGNPAFGPTVHQRFAEWSEARMWVELHRAPRRLPSPRRQPNWCNYG